jgi:hypothetical protein
MIEIDIKLGSKYVPPWRESITCMIAALVLTAVLANCGTVLGIVAWSNDGKLQLHDGGENS